MPDRKRILVVDDSRDTVELLCRHLENHGYDAIPAYGGVEAIQKARNETLDCVLLDIMMPNCSGLKVCHELKHQPGTSHLPVVILSAKKEPKDISYARQMGADEYLTKPISLGKLLKSLENHLRRNRPNIGFMSGPTVLFAGGGDDLIASTQAETDKAAVSGKDRLRLIAAESLDGIPDTVAAEAPKAVVIDARSNTKEAAQLCRKLKMDSKTKHVPVIALLKQASDDIKFAWANACLVDPISPATLAEVLRAQAAGKPA